MQRNTFIATVENDTIYAVNGVTQEKGEVGITKKSAKDLQDALAGIIQERDEYYQRLVDAKLIEPKRSAEEMAREALNGVQSLRSEIASMASILTNIQEALTAPKKEGE